MPVRMVKDDADESVLSDHFNFDNPEKESASSNRDDSWGGGSSQKSSAANGLFSFLGSMAVEACVSYAYRAFWSGGNNAHSSPQSQSFASETKIDHQVADDLLQQRLVSAEFCVSMWAHAILADGKMQQAEKEAVSQLVRDTVNKLFPHDIADQTLASSALQRRLKDPHSYQEVINEVSQSPAFSLNLYQQACLLIGSDDVLQDNENIFLANLATDLQITPDDANKARSKYNLF